MNKRINIILLMILSINCQTYAMNATIASQCSLKDLAVPLSLVRSVLESRDRIAKNGSYIIDYKKIKEKYGVDQDYFDKLSWSDYYRLLKEQNRRIEHNEIERKQDFKAKEYNKEEVKNIDMSQFKKPIQYFGPKWYNIFNAKPEYKNYVNPYKVYVVDNVANNNHNNRKMLSNYDSEDSNDSDSDDSDSDNIKLKKNKIPKYNRIVVMDKIISIPKTRLNKLINIANNSPKWSIAKMFKDEPEIGIAIEKYINNIKCMYTNNIPIQNQHKSTNNAKTDLSDYCKKSGNYKRENIDCYNILVSRINRIIRNMPNMPEVNKISIPYQNEEITQKHIDILYTLVNELNKALNNYTRIMNKKQLNNNTMLSKKRLLEKK